MNFAKILCALICILAISPANAINLYKVKEVDLDNLGYKQPVYRQKYSDSMHPDQTKIDFLGDPDNFPYTSKRQGSIFYELFSELFNDRHLYVEITYPKKDYQAELYKFENNISELKGVFGMPFYNSKYSKNVYVYPAFADIGIHLITSRDKNIDIQTKEDLKKYKGVYPKDDKFEETVLKHFKRLGILEREPFDYAIEDLLTGKVDFIVASYYRSQIKLYKLGLMNYINYSLTPIWKIPLFLKVNPRIAKTKNIEYIRQYIKSPSFKQKRDRLLANILEIYREKTKGVIPPTYINSLQSVVEE